MTRAERGPPSAPPQDDHAAAARDWRPLAALGLVVAAALLVRLVGAFASLPFLYDPDEPDFVERAFRMLATGDMNPRWFGHPGSVTMYSFWLTFAAQAAASGQSLAALAEVFRHDPALWYGLARAVVAACGAATVALTWLVARRVTGSAWLAVLAAALLAVAPVHVEYSRYARPDVQMTLLVLAVGWFALAIAERSRWRDYLGGGFVLGLATVTKYPAVVFALLLVLAHALRVGSARQPPWRDAGKLAGAGAAALAGAFAGSPWLFLSLPAALGDIAGEARSYHLSGTSAGFLDSLGWYLGGPLLTEIGVIGSALAAYGALIALLRRDRGGFLMLAAAAGFVLFIAALPLRWPRWVLPAVPFLCVLAAAGVGDLGRTLASRLPRAAAVALVVGAVLLALAGPASESLPWTQAAARGDTRDAAWRWLMANAPPGSAILAESYTPQLPPERYRLYTVSEGGVWRLESRGRRYAVPRGVIGTLADPDAARRAGIDYLVIAHHYDRRLAEPDRYAREIEVYERLMAQGEPVFEDTPAPRHAVGVPVRVYRLSSGP
jgi:4-amino-4-deoxy-L-arabinose transferase-like glycosyltransferase